MALTPMGRQRLQGGGTEVPVDDALIGQIGEWYAACDASNTREVLDGQPNEPVYVPLDSRPDPETGRPMYLRGRPVVEEMTRGIRLAESAGASVHLFSGFRGSGTSSELARLARRLEDSKRFTVLRIRAGQYHPLSEALGMEEMALLLAGAIGEKAAQVLGDRFIQPKSVWTRFRELLNAELKLEESGWNIAGLDFKVALHFQKDFRDRLRLALQSRPDLPVRFLHDFVREVAAHCPGQLVVLVDDLEKFDTPLENVASVYRAMADLFFQHADLFRLPRCHVVYTVPPYLAFLNRGLNQVYGGAQHVLPNVKVHSAPPERRPDPQGVAAMEDVLRSRVDLDLLFGPHRPECVHRLVVASGGHLRDLFSLARRVMEDALGEDSLPVGPALVEGAIQSFRNGRSFFFRDTRALLARVAATGHLRDLGDDELGALAYAMDQYLVLCYHNGSPWYDVHPLVLDEILLPLSAP